MGKVDHVHDAKHQRQPSGKQKKHQAHLQAVEHLLQDQNRIHRF
jgi:hypothetical protein